MFPSDVDRNRTTVRSVVEERNGPRSASQGSVHDAVVPVADVVRPPAQVPRRADALRNRARVLDAAQTLFAEHGVEAVSMDDVARAAGVGKGTLYRGFGDRAGLAMALLDDRARELQEGVLGGPGPLGPGPPPVERLVAFVRHYLRFQVEQLDLVLMSESGGSPGARLTKGSYVFWHRHVAWLLAEAGAPAAGLRAEVLLGALSAEQVRHWVRVRGRPVAELEAELVGAALALAAAPPAPGGV